MTHRLMLIGCSKTKKACEYDSRVGGRVIPEQLYGSQLFIKRVEYAKSNGLRWAVLSAKHGVWYPHIGMKPYDHTFGDMLPADIAAWHIGVAMHLVEELWEPFHEKESAEPLTPAELTIEIHAGNDYCHPLTEILTAVGIKVELPLKGLGIGEQLSWYCSAKPEPEQRPRSKKYARKADYVHTPAVDGEPAEDQPRQADGGLVLAGGKAYRDLFWAGAD